MLYCSGSQVKQSTNGTVLKYIFNLYKLRE